MAKKSKSYGEISVGGLFDGLNKLLENLGDLAEKGEEFRKSGEIRSSDGKVRGIYGFNIKIGLGDQNLKVEEFGNIHTDKRSGKITVDEVREPMADVFDEEKYVLVVVEMPGVGEEDIRLSLKDDVLDIVAEKGEKKYRKEVLLPETFAPETMSHTCHSGVLEIRFTK